MGKLLKQTRLIYFYLIVGFITIGSCTNDEPITIPEVAVEDVSLVFESFVFEKEKNPHLSEDIIFDIKDNTISGELKNYFFNSIPTFSSNAKIVEINNLAQVSGTSAVDFRKAITYTL